MGDALLPARAGSVRRMPELDAADMTEPPDPRSGTKSRVIAAVALVVGALLLLAVIRRRVRRGAADTVFDVVEESAATLAEVLVDELLPG